MLHSSQDRGPVRPPDRGGLPITPVFIRPPASDPPSNSFNPADKDGVTAVFNVAFPTGNSNDVWLVSYATYPDHPIAPS